MVNLFKVVYYKSGHEYHREYLNDKTAAIDRLVSHTEQGYPYHTELIYPDGRQATLIIGTQEKQ